MTQNNIKIRVKLFSIYQEAFDRSELELELPQQATVSNVLEHLIKQKPDLARWAEVTRFGINLEFAEPQTIIHDGDEIVLIPPVSGG